ncbi:MAG: T9SS type A sorting domain-containing protein [Paludibacter sp.]|nr:T9SS type A sorting domain-containing protein [Paludibacter sp.]
MKKQIAQLALVGLFIFMIQTPAFGQGSTYSGSYEVSAPIVLTGASNLTISNLQITNPGGNCITLTNCTNITIQNCKLGPSKGEGVSIENCNNITVVNCTMELIRTGVYAQASTGVKVNYNDVKNILGPMPRGQMVQFNDVSGADNSISFNVAENIAGQSATEDVISLYMSNGTELSPIKVAGNWIRGGGPSVSGGGIMTGDNGGSYVLVENNILVNPGQYGLSVAGGHHITIRNNKVYSQKFTFANIGLVAWNQYSFASYSNTIMNNEINYTNNNGVINNMWNAGNMGVVTGWDTNTYNSNVTASILPSKIIGRVVAITTDVPVAPVTNQIKIYPSVVNDHLTVESTSEIKNGTIEIFNIKGQRIINLPIIEMNTEISTSQFATGVYIVKILNNNEQLEVKKIIVGRN